VKPRMPDTPMRNAAERRPATGADVAELTGMVSPGPGGGNPQVEAAASAGDAGGGVQQPVGGFFGKCAADLTRLRPAAVADRDVQGLPGPFLIDEIRNVVSLYLDPPAKRWCSRWRRNRRFRPWSGPRR
jgi:hypothetical protein